MKLTLPKILLPLLAILLVGWWTVRESGSPADTGVGSGPALLPVPPNLRGNSTGTAAIPVGQIPGYSAPPIETATPAEVAALIEAEVQRSAKSTPPKTFIGIDGKPKAFQYNKTPETAAREEARDERRKPLMQQLTADPERFARDNQLSMKEVQWILDGTNDFPDRLLD